MARHPVFTMGHAIAPVKAGDGAAFLACAGTGAHIVAPLHLRDIAPGIKDADDEIRIGDEVFVTRNKKLCAVGVAQMNGEEMRELNQGEAIKIRHII